MYLASSQDVVYCFDVQTRQPGILVEQIRYTPFLLTQNRHQSHDRIALHPGHCNVIYKKKRR